MKPVFALWEKEADNAVLNKAALEAFEAYKSEYKIYKNGLPGRKELELLKMLLLSYNSDGRGWTPLPEHRLFCFNNAQSVKSKIYGI